MGRKKSDTSILVQGSVLAIASIVSRIIGLIYRIPMTNIIGEYGNDYYSCAYEIYSMVLLISSYSLPMAVSKLVSARMSRHEVQSANRVYLGALLIAAITGVAGGLFVFFGSGFLTRVFQTPLSFLALRVLAPTIVVVAVLGVLRGFFQGLGTMVPSAVSQILEQIINAVVSVGAAFILFGYGTKVASVIGGEQHYAEAYGAAGGTLGTSMGALAGLVFIIIIFILYRRRNFKKELRRQKHVGAAEVEPFGPTIKILLLTIFPILISTTLYNLVSIVDQGLFKNLAIMQGNAADSVSLWWGVYSGYYRVLINVPIAISTAIATSMVPALASAFARKDHEQVRHRIGLAMRFIMIIAMPCAVGMAVLARPIINMLYNTTSDALAALLLQTGAISIIFYSISTLSNAVLQSIDQMRIPIRNAVIALAANVAAVPICLFVFHMNIYTMIVGNIVFSLVMCILNGLSVHKYSGYSPQIRKTYVLPAIASVLMGVIVYVVYFLLHRFVISSNTICCIIGIVVGIVSYAVILLLVKGITEEELESFPRGTMIIRIAKKLRLLR